MDASLRSTRLLVAACALLGLGVRGADKNKPHFHTGVLPKFKAGPPAGIGFKLSSDQQKALSKGENVLATIANKGGGGSCVAVLDIEAPKRIIWERITDYKRTRAPRARVRRAAGALCALARRLTARPPPRGAIVPIEQATRRW